MSKIHSSNLNKFKVSKWQTINKSAFQNLTFQKLENKHFIIRSSNISIFNISKFQNSTLGDRTSFLAEPSSRRTFLLGAYCNQSSCISKFHATSKWCRKACRNSSGARACHWRAQLYIVCRRHFFRSKYSPLRTPFSTKWHNIGIFFLKIPIHTFFVASACLNCSNRTHVFQTLFSKDA